MNDLAYHIVPCQVLTRSKGATSGYYALFLSVLLLQTLHLSVLMSSFSIFFRYDRVCITWCCEPIWPIADFQVYRGCFMISGCCKILCLLFPRYNLLMEKLWWCIRCCVSITLIPLSNFFIVVVDHLPTLKI